MASYRFTKYVCTKDNLRKTLKKYGAAIIPSVLSEEECESMVSKIWDFLEHITKKWEKPLDRNDPNTWKEFTNLYPLHSMLLQHYSVGHAQASWDVRQNPKIVEIFAHFWDCSSEDLLVSFDGLSFHLPPEVTNRGWNRGNAGYHTDQSFTETGFKCMQSFVSGLDINEDDATFSFFEKSNRYQEEFREKYEITDKRNWYKLEKEQLDFYFEKGCKLRNIKCPKGSLVLWDSRTIHCGIEPNKERIQPNLRAVIYLCYMPKKLCSEKDLNKKRKALAELRTTSHYPCHIRLFSKQPRTYGGELQEITPIEPPVLTDLGKSLAGI